MISRSLAERFWRWAFRLGWARPMMPLWRVVVDARAPRFGHRGVGVVTGILVWANDAEEAEALARLKVAADGYEPVTADAMRATPCTRPRRDACVVSSDGYAVYGADDQEDAERAR
jgi:hypothetical protein